MVFKKLFFSLKKSRSSDSSNSPRSVGSNSPVESDKKKSKSDSKEETRSPNRSLSFRLCLKTKTKDDSSKGKDASSSQVQCPNPGKSNLSSSGDETPLPTSEVKEEPTILASFLGLNRNKTRSTPLPQECTGSDLGSGLATSGSVSGIAKKEEGSSSPALLGTGQFKVSPSYSGPVGRSEFCTPKNWYELENPRKRFHGDIKSFSHELNSKGVRSFPLWKPRGLHNVEEIWILIRTKFDKEKEEVNSDLATFAWDLVSFLNSHHELQLQIEDLLLLARKCVETTPGEFWFQCEHIVQKLDDRRQDLSPGLLKQLHTRMLFILTRCTRLLQLYNENWEQEVVQLRQSRVLHSADKRVCTGEVRDWRVWKRFSSPASKGVKESAVSKEQNDSKVEPPKVIIPFEEISILCRICEEEVCTTYVEDHSRICALADKYDKKSVSVDERLVALAVTLDKIIEFVQNNSLAAVESPDGMKISNASLTQESDILSPKAKRRDWSRRVSEDMLDCFLEADNSAFMDDIRCRTSVSCRTRFGLKSDQGMTTSPAGRMTPRSPIPTPKPDLIELLLGGRVALHDQNDIPQMSELAVIAICAASVNPDGDHSTELLLSCLQDLKVVIKSRKFDALIVETFGKRIENFIMKKYLQLCKILGDQKVDLSGTVIDEDAPLEDDVVRSLRKSPVHPRDRTSIEDFEIIKEISRGAFGRVFLAKKRMTGDIFAIKVLKKADMIRKNAVKSILAERDILINACNPFVVRFFYSFTCPKKLYLVMEYLNGGDFYSLLRKLGSLDESIACIYIAEIVLALEYLHSEGVVHRDLKPDNLLISHDGHVKLTDFGLSKVGLINSTDDLSGPVLSGTSLLVEEKPKLPASEHQLEQQDKQSAVGTPDYLAPEILLGTEHGAAVDWWSVGIILFELIVGIPPFNADHPQEIFENILNRNIPWPRVPEDMSPEARDLIDRLLTKDPKQRLGARGAAEVKQHIFFEGINWDTLGEQKAAFVPDSKNALDTSYFQSRYSSSISDEQCVPTKEKEYSSDRGSSGCFSNHHNEGVDERDELAEFEMSEDHPFNNYSLKNLVALGFLTRDVMYKYETQPRSHRR